MNFDKKPQIGELMNEIDMRVPSVVENVVLSEDGKVMFTSCRDVIRVWNLYGENNNTNEMSKNPNFKEFYSSGRVGCLGLLMDKKTLVSTSDGTVNIYDYSVLGGDFKIPKSKTCDSDEDYENSELNFDEEFGQRPSLKPMPKFGADQNLEQIDLNLSLDDYDPLPNKPSTKDLIEQLNIPQSAQVFARTRLNPSENLILEKTHFSREPAIELINSFGFNGLKGRRNVTWAKRAGFLVYDSSCYIIKEDITDGEQVIFRKTHSQMVGNNRGINCISLKNDGKFLALSLESQGVYKPQLEIISLESDPEAPVRVLSHGHRKNIVSMCFSRDDRFLFTASDDRVIVWDSYNWSMIQQAVQTSCDSEQLCVKITADHCSAERFAICWQNKVEIYYLDEEERKLKRLVLVAPGKMRRGEGKARFTSVCFNTWQDKSERVIFGSLSNGVVIAWKINDGKQVGSFKAAETEITNLVTENNENSIKNL